MGTLPGPYELLDLEDEETLTTKIESFDAGEVKIETKRKPEGKFVNTLRVHVPQHSKDYFPFYWDITSQTLIAQLMPFLEQPGYAQKTYTITKHGVAPRARFTLIVKGS